MRAVTLPSLAKSSHREITLLIAQKSGAGGRVRPEGKAPRVFVGVCCILNLRKHSRPLASPEKARGGRNRNCSKTKYEQFRFARAGRRPPLRDRAGSKTKPNLRIPARNTRGQAFAGTSSTASRWAA